MVVIECVPSIVAQAVTEALTIPTIGITILIMAVFQVYGAPPYN